MSKYREIEYSVSSRGDGKWRWSIHHNLQAGVSRQIISSEVSGSQDDAIAAAKAAIDIELGKSN